jgi:hypothetical protein
VARAASTEADHALGIHDAMPRDGCAIRQSVQRIANEPGVAFEIREAGDLAVRRNAPAGNLRDDPVDRAIGRREAAGAPHRPPTASGCVSLRSRS